MSIDLGGVLAPLRERYASWLDLDAAGVARDREEDPSQVRAIQLVLRLERGDPPSWHRALELAATGCALLCLDPRSAPGGEWHEAVADYCAGHIRKVTRRARGAPWEAVQDVPGMTLTAGTRTEVRVLVPGLVGELDPRVRKLQVGGTDVPVDGPETEQIPGALVLHVPQDTTMTTGKLMAQAGHAGMIASALRAPDDPSGLAAWHGAGCPTHVVRTPASEWRLLLTALSDPATAWSRERMVAVRDAGFTEVDPGTVTVLARLTN